MSADALPAVLVEWHDAAFAYLTGTRAVCRAVLELIGTRAANLHRPDSPMAGQVLTLLETLDAPGRRYAEAAATASAFLSGLESLPPSAAFRAALHRVLHLEDQCRAAALEIKALLGQKE